MTARSIAAMAFAVCVASATAQTPARPKSVSWGPNEGRLQMAVWANPNADTLFAAVRNPSRRAVCTCGPLGDEHSYGVFVRRDSASPWQQVQLAVLPAPYEAVAICNTRTVPPNGELPPMTLPSQGHTFAVRLQEYAFPAELTGGVDVKIELSVVYCDPYGKKISSVESRPIRIQLPVVGA